MDWNLEHSRTLLDKLIVAQPIKKIPGFYETRIHKIPPLGPILSRMNPIHTFTPRICKIFYNIVLSAPKFSNWSLPFRI
jgi:hypothetical protein